MSRDAILAYERLDTSKAEGIHRDSFDRMLITLANSEKQIRLSNDRSFENYDEDCIWAV